MTLLAALVSAAVLLGQGTATVEIRDVAPEKYPQVSAVVRVVDDRGRAVPGLGPAMCGLRRTAGR